MAVASCFLPPPCPMQDRLRLCDDIFLKSSIIIIIQGIQNYIHQGPMFLHICDIVCCMVFVDFLHLCFVFHLGIIDGDRILSCPGKVGGMPPAGRHQGNSRRQRLGGKLLPGSKIDPVGICFLKISMRQGFKIDAPQSCNFVGRESLKIHVWLCLPNHLGVSKNRGTPKWMVYNGNAY